MPVIDAVGLWGSPGSGDGQFSGPSTVSVSSNGDVYVADPGNSRIQAFDSQGKYLSQFGSPGSGNGQFRHPSDLAFAANGDILVVESGNSRVQIFDAQGHYLSKFGYSARKPTGIAIAPDGRLYVSTFYHHVVQIYSASGTYLSAFGSATGGNANGQFNGPNKVDFSPNGQLFVSDSNNDRIQVLDGNGIYLSQFGATGSDDERIDFPRGVAFGEQGLVYVVDTEHDRIQVYDASGQQVGHFGSSGSGAGQFDRPMDIAIGQSNLIYVAELDNNRIQIFRATYLDEGLPPTGTVHDATAPSSAGASLSGTVSATNAAITVALYGISYPAVNHGDGTWSLPLGSLPPLASGPHLVTATFSNPHGSTSATGVLTLSSLLAVIGNIQAFTRAGQVCVEWETVAAWNTAGFYLERQVAGEWIRVSRQLVAYPLFAQAPVVFVDVDPGVLSGETHPWRLVEIENNGHSLIHGPYLLTVDGPGRTYEAWAAAYFTPEETVAQDIGGRDADPDGDGQTNGQEFLAGSDPLQPEIRIVVESIRRLDSGVELGWRSATGHRYRIAVSDTPQGPFLPLQKLILATNDYTREILDADFPSSAVYFQIIGMPPSALLEVFTE